jgi:DNA-binding response OmpR family regulator
MKDTTQGSILIISADCTPWRTVRACLQEAGYRVFAEDYTENVLAVLTRVNPQLVLLDWNLPGSGALAVTRSIREDRRFLRLPIILTGGDMTSDSRIASLDAGADLCLDSSVYPREFVARVRALLRRCSSVGPACIAD